MGADLGQDLAAQDVQGLEAAEIGERAAAAALRIRDPHRLGHMIEPSRLARKLPTWRP